MLTRMLSDLMIKPGAAPVFGSPADYKLDYETVSFETKDGVTLRGWLINSGAEKVVVQSHFGVQCSRSGYTPDGKGLIKLAPQRIDFLKHAQYLASRGYSVLMYDLRNHGDSDQSTPPWVSWGPDEHADVVAAVDFASNHPHLSDARIHLLSICMGASASTFAFAASGGLANRKNIASMAVIQPLSYGYFTKAYGIPGFLDRRVSKLNEKRTGHDFANMTFLPEVEHIDVPTVVVQNKNDPWTSLNLVNEYYDRLKTEKELIWLDLDKTRAAAYEYLTMHPEEILWWFDKHA